jgi:beta-lactamase class D
MELGASRNVDLSREDAEQVTFLVALSMPFAQVGGWTPTGKTGTGARVGPLLVGAFLGYGGWEEEERDTSDYWNPSEAPSRWHESSAFSS